jgi:hypothetical protein
MAFISVCTEVISGFHTKIYAFTADRAPLVVSETSFITGVLDSWRWATQKMNIKQWMSITA